MEVEQRYTTQFTLFILFKLLYTAYTLNSCKYAQIPILLSC